MGNIQSLNKISFQDMQTCIEENYTIITVMKDDKCCIKGTTPIYREEDVINKLYSTDRTSPIVIYGYNDCDNNIARKYQQLKELGFHNLYIYPGGLFEWLMLQDIYSDKFFKTTINDLNLLKYKPNNIIRKN